MNTRTLACLAILAATGTVPAYAQLGVHGPFTAFIEGQRQAYEDIRRQELHQEEIRRRQYENEIMRRSLMEQDAQRREMEAMRRELQELRARQYAPPPAQAYSPPQQAYSQQAARPQSSESMPRSSAKFKGYACVESNCTENRHGFEWGRAARVARFIDCENRGFSVSYQDGCYAAVDEAQERNPRF